MRLPWGVCRGSWMMFDSYVVVLRAMYLLMSSALVVEFAQRYRRAALLGSAYAWCLLAALSEAPLLNVLTCAHRWPRGRGSWWTSTLALHLFCFGILRPHWHWLLSIPWPSQCRSWPVTPLSAAVISQSQVRDGRLEAGVRQSSVRP